MLNRPAPPNAVGAVEAPVQKISGAVALPEADLLAVEEPLEIRLGFTRGHAPLTSPCP